MIDLPHLQLRRLDLTIYLDIVIEALQPHNRAEIDGENWGVVLHGAGPDMIKYATGLWRELSALHGHVLRQLPELGIPRKIVFGLIPTAELKLSLPEPERGSLDELATLVAEKDELRKIQKDRQRAPEERDQAQTRTFGVRDAIRKAVLEGGISKIELDRPFSTHHSQYDIIAGSGPIYFPEGLAKLTFAQLREINNGLSQIQKKGS